jgi:hypothetical protein
LAFTATAADPDTPSNTLTFSLDPGAPAGATIDANSGEFTWTPSETQGPGTYNLTVRVSDDGAPNLGSSATLSIQVEDPSPWQYFAEPLDVNRDGSIAPIDALIVINDLNETGARILEGLPRADSHFLDVNGDKSVAPIDALIVINGLNERLVLAEGESAFPAELPSVFLWQPFADAATNLSSESRCSRDTFSTASGARTDDVVLVNEAPDQYANVALKSGLHPNARGRMAAWEFEDLLDLISQDVATSNLPCQ